METSVVLERCERVTKAEAAGPIQSAGRGVRPPPVGRAIGYCHWILIARN